MKLAYQIEKGCLGGLELKFFDLDQPIKFPCSPLEPPYVLLERHTVGSTPQGVVIAHRRGAIPVPEEEKTHDR